MAPDIESPPASGTTTGSATPAQEPEPAATPAPIPSPAPAPARLLASLRDDVSLAYADYPILICCAVSGLCDSVAFNASGVFVSMQTGNTIFLALGAAHLPGGQPQLWLKALVSIAAFWAGCFLFSKSRHIHPQRKITLAASFFVQAACIIIAAALAQSGVVEDFDLKSLPSSGSGHEIKPSEDPRVLAPIALMAFQFGGQIVSSRVLGFNEVPTNVLTSLYCDLLSDPALMAPLGKNPKRNRRVVAAILLVVGGISGGWLQRSKAGMSSVLWIAGGIKFALAVAWLVWRSKPVDPTSEKLKK